MTQAKQFLQVGDVVVLQKGMGVYTNLPKKFVYQNRPFSTELTEAELTIGAVKSVKVDINAVKDEITKGIKERFYSSIGADVDDAVIAGLVDPVLAQFKPEQLDTSEFEGEYVVTSTSMKGGSGPDSRDPYPDGHHVVCKQMRDGKILDGGHTVSFFQSGHFTVMIHPLEIQPIRKMQMTFI
jgi:hypothetical protein